MNLVCYPHYTGGGLLCNILNKTPEFRTKIGETVTSMEHFLFIGDNWSVYDSYDVAEFDQTYEKVFKQGFNPDWLSKRFLGTHCHPILLDTAKFSNVISITTESLQSKLYRWLRAYNLFFKPQWEQYTGMGRIDLMRETAKSYLTPFYQCDKPNIHHIEFSDIVNKTSKLTTLCQHLVVDPDLSRVDTWVEKNQFIFSRDTPEYNSFMEADYEVSTKEHYAYN
jgi:hypothetical protein